MTIASRRLVIGAAVAVLAIAVHQRTMSAGPTIPTQLSETGLFGPQSAAPGPRSFSPQYPLWTDGASKRRWVSLPEGTTIDVTDPDRWVFPDGTRFWKEFTFNGRKVETRLLWKRDGEWTFASYAWSEDQTTATLAPEAGLTTDVQVAPGRLHRIPSTTECRACHVSGRTEILGFTALQLSDDRDPHALHAEALTDDMVTLRTLLAERRLSPARTEWLTTPPRIAAPDAQTRTVLGYLSTNCGSCHNATSEIATLDLVLKDGLAQPQPCPDSLATTVDRPSRWEVPRVPPDTSRRLAPGHADLSTVVARMRSRTPSSQMPPLGTVVVDEAAVALVTTWIAADAATWATRRAGC